MLSFDVKSYSSLTVDEFHDIISLRERVFIVEQNCPYLDVDGKDKKSHHVIGLDAFGNLVATARLLPVGVSYQEYASIGRVCVDSHIRRTQAGIELMRYAMRQMKALYPNVPIKISAQSYLLNFYGKFGFNAVGEPYLEDNIPHQSMAFYY
jgi:ElaA protein